VVSVDYEQTIRRMGEPRARIGDLEGDPIVGRTSRSAIVPMVDRRTGYLRLVHVPDGHSAEQLRVAMLPILTELPAALGRP
jgi:IS30 family transposase